MRHPGQHFLVLASERVPWLLPAVGFAVFVHKHFISYQGQGSAAVKAKASSRPRPPKLRRASKKTKSANSDTLLPVDCAADAELERLEAVGLSSDKLMEWFTEDEVEALQQVQANQTAALSLLSGTRFMADEHSDASEDAQDWYTDEGEQLGLQDLDYASYDTYNNSDSNSYNNSRRSSIEGNGFQIKPLSELTQALAGNSSREPSTGNSPDNQQQQQQQWEAARQLLQQLADQAQQEQWQAAEGSESSVADYFDPAHYYGLSPAENGHGPASLDMMQGGYLPRTGAQWASSYPPHLDELDDVDSADDEYEHEEPVQLQMQNAHQQLGPSVTNPASSNEQQQQQQQREQNAARWLADYAPPTHDFEPDFDIDLDYDIDYDYDPDYVPDFIPNFDDELGFDQLDAAFITAAAAHA